MNVLFAVSEMAPWVKTGGLGDVTGALPAALRHQGLDVRVLLPLYPALRQTLATDAVQSPVVASIAPWAQLPGAQLRMATTPHGVPLYLLDCPALFERPGNPYLGADGRDWPDNALRFGLLAYAAARLASADSPLGWRPQVLHCHDWQSALAPAYLHYRGMPGAAACVLTVHNLAFQGLFGPDQLALLGLPEAAWRFDGVEYYGQLSFLKAGLQFADAITTVSPRYAREIQTDADGMGLGGLLRWRAGALAGIVNGIDTQVWNPASDALLTAPYDATRLERKARNTAALRLELGLAPAPETPLLGVVSRLTYQKGLDLLPPIADQLLDLPAQLVVLGSGEPELEQALHALAQRHPGRIAVRIGFDEGLAHRIEAGADFFLMPSRFEPCGLNQLYSLRYGTPPIVRATGGLADTVVDADAAGDESGNGFVFDDASAPALLATIARACALWRTQPLRYAALQRRGMSGDYSWQEPARQTAAVYRRLMGTSA